MLNSATPKIMQALYICCINDKTIELCCLCSIHSLVNFPFVDTCTWSIDVMITLAIECLSMQIKVHYIVIYNFEFAGNTAVYVSCCSGT